MQVLLTTSVPLAEELSYLQQGFGVKPLAVEKDTVFRSFVKVPSSVSRCITIHVTDDSVKVELIELTPTAEFSFGSPCFKGEAGLSERHRPDLLWLLDLDKFSDFWKPLTEEEEFFISGTDSGTWWFEVRSGEHYKALRLPGIDILHDLNLGNGQDRNISLYYAAIDVVKESLIKAGIAGWKPLK